MTKRRKTKGDFTLRMDAKRLLTPKPGKGYNVVGVDTYEQPGEELFLVGNFRSKAEAERAKEAREKESSGEPYYVYPPSPRGLFDPES